MSLLPWLPRHEDLSGALRQARGLADSTERLRAAIALAGHDRDAIITGRIDRVAIDSIAAGPGLASLAPMRLALLGSHTLDHVLPSIRVAGLARGVQIAVHLSDYGQYRQVLLGGDPGLTEFAPQLLLLALDSHAVLPTLPLSASRDEAQSAVESAVGDLRQLWRLARDRFGARPMQQTFVSPTPPLLGSSEAFLPASPHRLCAELNARLVRVAADDGVLLVDVDALMPASHGPDLRTDPVRWYQAKQLINPVFAPLYGDLVARVVAAAAGRSRKCLVLDLDNTLWGGVIGDDGLAGVKLGQGSPEGEAFVAFQAYAARLAECGIPLAVCSKNDHDVARAMFDQHPDMRIAFADVACFVANWQDKATNLRAIARTLNIGTDSLVFVDDNPAERAIIRRELPEVAVPEMPEEPALYPARLSAAGYFESAGITADDFARSKAYAANAARVAAVDQPTDLDGFLLSLSMTLRAKRIDAIDRPRAAQLINKSNQFNLTTRRRTEVELDTLLADQGSIALSFRLQDRFGDNGLISVVLLRPDDALPRGELLIDTWLMSCRVLGRGVEAAVLEVLLQTVCDMGVTAIIGEYRPSGRNEMVREHYARLGFDEIMPPAGAAEGARFWRLACPDARVPEHHITVELVA